MFCGDDGSIENGYFILALWPSTFCKLRCPHCYLTLEQRQDSSIFSLENLQIMCRKVYDYYESKGLNEKTIICYWYGGEPTTMGTDYFLKAVNLFEREFPKHDGYTVRHLILSALVGVKEEWFPIIKEFGNGEIQTSYDGSMRGESYLKVWEKQIATAQKYDLRVTTISTINYDMLNYGAVETLEYLNSLGIKETSWLPLLQNDHNTSNGQFSAITPTMTEWSEFMIELTDHWVTQMEKGVRLPEIGQMHYVLENKNSMSLHSPASQTLWLMPNGDFSLSDYDEHNIEKIQKFGNILENEFADILTSKARRSFLRRQTLRNGNPECINCDLGNCCFMESWKNNRENDDCYGAKNYVTWVLRNEARIKKAIGSVDRTIQLF